MFKRCKGNISDRKRDKQIPVISTGNKISSEQNTFDTEGFFIPQLASDLLATPLRQHYLKQLNQNIALPEKSYQTLCFTPLRTLAAQLQIIPASQVGKFSHEGGLLDLSLEMAVYSIRLSLKEMFPQGAPSEEQAKQHSAWNVAVFYAGLFYWLPLVAQFEGQLNDMTFWQPGLSQPRLPFRFRFQQRSCDFKHDRQTIAALISLRLLPEEALQWLACYPTILNALTECLTGVIDRHNDLQKVLHAASHLFPPELLPSGATCHNQIIDTQMDSAKNTEKLTLPSTATIESLLMPSPEDITVGQIFWRWLKTGLLNGEIAINTPDAKVHCVLGDLYCQSPAIFYQFKHCYSSETVEINQLITAFEALQLHRTIFRNNTRIGHFKGRLYSSPLATLNKNSGKLSHRKIHGYLIKSRLVFGTNVPDETVYVSMAE